MMKTKPSGILRLDKSAGSSVAHIVGDWTLANFSSLKSQVEESRQSNSAPSSFDLSQLSSLDTSGASLLVELIGDRIDQFLGESNLSPERRSLINTVSSAVRICNDDEKPKQQDNTKFDIIESIGIASESFGKSLVGILGFIGIILQTLASSLLSPRRWRLTSLAAQIETTGLNAVPIVFLLSFMVGAVVAFLGATVLGKFGASVYTVDLVGYSFLREFGVLLTAILMAGRSASAFTAQIGSMKANQEIDAIQTIGLDPVELLVLPRVLALLFTLPLLTFIAMLSGILGGGTVCALSLDIPPRMFLHVLQTDIAVQHFWVGMVKAPIFAFIISAIGCLEGWLVTGSSQSVGSHTTSSVVQSIFSVIVIDAIAALYFMEMNW